MKANRTVAPLQVYDGQTLLGEIEDHGRGRVIAFRLNGRRRIEVGTFPTRIDAMRVLAKPIRSAVTSGQRGVTEDAE
jgi:hypothetical protein